jgi:acyl carrier protein
MSQPSMDSRTLLAEALGRAPAEIPDDAAIGVIDAWDSLGHLRIVMAVEARLGRELTSEEILAVDSLGAISRLLESPAAA